LFKRVFKKFFFKVYVSGVDRVFVNLKKSFDLLGVKYRVNVPFNEILPHERVIVLGRDIRCLDGYNNKNTIVAGIGLMTHPTEWLTLFDDYPVVCYLQHCDWTNNLYKKYYGDKCDTWPVGIDTKYWMVESNKKEIDFLIYNKIRFGDQLGIFEMILNELQKRGLNCKVINYGRHDAREYRNLLGKSKSMVFLCEHESQGIAYQECLSCNVPVLAWDTGFIADPYYKKLEGDNMKVSSVPFFDFRCGMKFRDYNEFINVLPKFLKNMEQNIFQPRNYILENLSLEVSGNRMLEILKKYK
jgi:hypothetical protein